MLSTFYQKYKLEVFLIVALYILLHGINLFDVYVNYEYAFMLATVSWLHPSRYLEAIEHYWHVQANPLGYSLINFLFYKITFIPVAPWSNRLLSLFSGAALIFTIPQILHFFNYPKRKSQLITMILVGFGPLVWIYGGRACGDLLPIGLIFIAIYFLTISQKRFSLFILSSLIFSLAVIVKYHSALLGFSFLYIIFMMNDLKFDKNFIIKSLMYGLIPIAVLLTYLVIVYKQYNIVVIAESASRKYIILEQLMP